MNRRTILKGLGFLALAGVLVAVVFLRDYFRPVPRDLVGRWENSQPLIDAAPGHVRLDIDHEGIAHVQYDRSRYKWELDELKLQGRGGQLTVQMLPDGEPFQCDYELTGDRFRINLANNTAGLPKTWVSFQRLRR